MTDNQLASLSWCRAPIWSPWPDFCFLFHTWGFIAVGRHLWWEDGFVVYCTIASGLCQSNHSGVQVPQISGLILLSHVRLPQPGGPGPHIFIPQEQGGSVIGHWETTNLHYIVLEWTSQKTSVTLLHVLYHWGNSMSRELFPISGSCTVSCLHRSNIVMDLHVTVF
jgi:hypothetical protein